MPEKVTKPLVCLLMRVLTPGFRYFGDRTPIGRGERLWSIVLAPLTITVFGLIVLFSIPYFKIFPDHHPHA